MHLRNELPFNVTFEIDALVPLKHPRTVPPQGTAVFSWIAREREADAGRVVDAPSTRLVVYHSHLAAQHHHAGLVGPLLLMNQEFARLDRAAAGSAVGPAARETVLRESLTHPPRDVDLEYVVLLQHTNEDLSPLAERNYQRYGTIASANVTRQNRKFSINGRSFGSLPGLEARVGDRVRLHVATIGDDAAESFGVSLDRHVPSEPVVLLAGQAATRPRDFVISTAGRLQLANPFGNDSANGMYATLVVSGGAPVLPPTTAPPTALFLRAEPAPWNANLCMFRQYADNTSAALPLPLDERRGVVGPHFRFVEGEHVVVTLTNNCTADTGIDFPGLLRVAPVDAVLVQRGATARFDWRAPERTPHAPTHRLLYRGAAQTLVGTFSVEPNGAAVDQVDAVPLAVLLDDVAGAPTINGYANGVPGLTFQALSVVRLDLFSLADERADLLIENAWRATTNQPFLPLSHARSQLVKMPFAGTHRIYNPYGGGSGVGALLTTVNGPAAAVARSAIARLPVRRLFVRAETHTWDYAPMRRDPTVASANCTGDACWRAGSTTRLLAKTAFERPVWVQYTDEKFTTKLGRVPRFDLTTEFLGFLGPMLRVLHNERIELHLRSALPAGSEPVQLTIGNCFERVSGIDSSSAPVRLNDSVSVAPGSTLVLHYVVAQSLREHIDSGVSFSSHGCTYRNGFASSDRSMHGFFVITRSGMETSAADMVPLDSEHEYAMIFDKNNGIPNVNGFTAANIIDLLDTHRYDPTRTYLSASEAVAVRFEGGTLADEHGDLGEWVSIGAMQARTVQRLSDYNGTFIVSASTWPLAEGGFGAFTIINFDANEAIRNVFELAEAREVDGTDVMQFHRSYGRANNSVSRLIPHFDLQYELAPPLAVAELFRLFPPAATARRPRTSQLTDAFSAFFLADMVQIAADTERPPLCVDAAAVQKGNFSACALKMAPTRTQAAVDRARSAAGARQVQRRAVGLSFDRTAIDKEPLPSAVNTATSWIDASPVYGSTKEENRRVRTFSGGLLTTDQTLWPIQHCSIHLRTMIDLFVRDHNRRARLLAAEHKDWDDERLYRTARRLVVGAVQLITEQEWLQALVGDVLPRYVASNDDAQVVLTQGTMAPSFEVFALESLQGHDADLRADVSLFFAFACAPALAIGGTPLMIELLNSAGQPIFGPRSGLMSGAVENSDSASIPSSLCSGDAAAGARCYTFGVEAVLRGLFTAASVQVDVGVPDAQEFLRLDRTPGLSSVSEWILRGREQVMPSFADFVRLRGAQPPPDIKRLVGLPGDANLTALIAAAYARARDGGLFDARPLLARELEKLYPRGIEQVDAIVGLLVEPPTQPLSTSVGPTLSSCLVTHVQRARAADRLWYANGVTNKSEIVPNPARSTMYQLLLANYDFSSRTGGATTGRGRLVVPLGFEAQRDAVARFLAARQFIGGSPRAARLAFHQGATADLTSKNGGFAPGGGNCVFKPKTAMDPLNNGLEAGSAHVAALRASSDAALFANVSDADIISLFGAVAVTLGSDGGLVMNWRAGRSDLPAGAVETPSVCPLGRLPLGLVEDDDAYPHARTLAHNRAVFARQGFNDREFVALSGAHALGVVQQSTSGFPNGLWTLQKTRFDNTYFRNLLAFATAAHRQLVRGNDGKFSYKLLAGAHEGEVGVTMLPSDVALLGDATLRSWVELYARDNAALLRDFAHSFQRMLEANAVGVGAPLPQLSNSLVAAEVGDVDESAEMNALGSPPRVPFFAARGDDDGGFGLFGALPEPLNGRLWTRTLLALPTLRFSFSGDENEVTILLETPSESYVGFGHGRVAGSQMRGADMLQVAMRVDGSVIAIDGFALEDLAQPVPDASVNGTSDWKILRAERADGISRYWATRARRTDDKLDKPLPATGAVDLMFAIGSVALRDGIEDDVLATYHASVVAVLPVELALPPVTTTTMATSARPFVEPEENDDVLGLVIGLVVGAVALVICVVVAALCFVRRQRQRSDIERAKLQSELLGEVIVDGERVPVPTTLKEVDLNDREFPLTLVNPAAGLFRDPVLLKDYNEAQLVARRAAQQNQQVPVRGMRMLVCDKIYCDVMTLQNTSDQAQQITFYLPSPAATQYKLSVQPQTVLLPAHAAQTFKVSVAMNCTTKQKFSLFVGTAHLVAETPVVRIESELSTALDFDEIQLVDRIGEGSFGVVYAARWRKQPVAVKLLRNQQLAAEELSELRAESKFLSQLLHRNVVQFRGCVFRPPQCCIVTELAPHGSLKVVVNSFSLPWDLVIKMAVDVACGLQFLHVSGIIHRDVKSDNVLVFSLSAREVVCAKLTDFGSARAAKAHIDATGKVQLGADRHHSQADGTPIYMSPQLFAKTSRPSEASDCYALACLFYEIAAEREPWHDIMLAWDIAKAVMAGKRPVWPANVLKTAPAPFVPLVQRMWAQQAEARPTIDEVLNTLADCQSAIGDEDAAALTRHNLKLDANLIDGGIDKNVALASAANNTSSFGSSGGPHGSQGSTEKSNSHAEKSNTHRTASTMSGSELDSSDPTGTQSSVSSDRRASPIGSDLGSKSSKSSYAVAMGLLPKAANFTTDSQSFGSDDVTERRRTSELDAKRVTGGIVPKNRTITGAPAGSALKGRTQDMNAVALKGRTQDMSLADALVPSRSNKSVTISDVAEVVHVESNRKGWTNNTETTTDTTSDDRAQVPDVVKSSIVVAKSHTGGKTEIASSTKPAETKAAKVKEEKATKKKKKTTVVD